MVGDRKRLQLTYGPAATLKLQDAEGGGLEAELMIYIVNLQERK